jgi:solute carrier family 40 (iron-regulated transporter), member 1
MRRIDLLCKLMGPLAISLIDGFSTKLAILVTLGLSVVSIGVEYFAIAQVIGN